MDLGTDVLADPTTFARSHDDGRSLGDLDRAHLVLVGVSGTGKTSVAEELAARGVLVANVPILPRQTPPTEVDRVPTERIVALTAKASALIRTRRARMGRVGEAVGGDHCRVDGVRRELLAAHRLFRERGWRTIDTTSQTPSETVDLIQALVAMGEDR